MGLKYFTKIEKRCPRSTKQGEAKGMVKTHKIKGFSDKLNALMHWPDLHLYWFRRKMLAFVEGAFKSQI